MGSRKEKIQGNTKSSYRKNKKLLKRETAKAFRRKSKALDKELLESEDSDSVEKGLPAKRTKGWDD